MTSSAQRSDSSAEAIWPSSFSVGMTTVSGTDMTTPAFLELVRKGSYRRRFSGASGGPPPGANQGEEGSSGPALPNPPPPRLQGMLGTRWPRGARAQQLGQTA